MLRRAVVVGIAAMGGLGLGPASGAAQWVEQPGFGWVSVAYYHLDTSQRFDEEGIREDFDFDGHTVTNSLFVDVAAGLFNGVDFWGQAPIHALRFTDASGDLSRTGMGDVRLWLRANPTRWFGKDFPVALRGGVKIPGSEFPVDSRIIPLTDGQRDWELMLELGHSFWPAPLYAMGWVGYRWREANEETSRDWGDEVFFFAAAGANSGRLGFKVDFEGFWGDTPVIEGLPIASASRRLLALTPYVSYQLGPGGAQGGVRFSLSGQNIPAGPVLTLGYFTRWSLLGSAQ